MSCRSTPGSSAAVSVAHLVSGLDDGAVSGLFHALKREAGPDGTQAGDLAEWSAALDSVEVELGSADGTDRARARIAARLAQARAGEVPDVATVRAVAGIGDAARDAARVLRERVFPRAAAALGLQEDQVGAAVRYWRDNASRFEDVAAPDAHFRYDWAPGVPADKATGRALRKLGYEAYLAQPLPVFVYGTLRPGQHNFSLMADAADAAAAGRLSGVGVYGADRGFPYAAEHADPEAVAVGDVVWLRDGEAGDKARASLDWLEGFDSDAPSGSHYERVARDVVTEAGPVRAWVYLARGSARAQLVESDRIVAGDWVAARAAWREPRPRYGW